MDCGFSHPAFTSFLANTFEAKDAAPDTVEKASAMAAILAPHIHSAMREAWELARIEAASAEIGESMKKVVLDHVAQAMHEHQRSEFTVMQHGDALSLKKAIESNFLKSFHLGKDADKLEQEFHNHVLQTNRMLKVMWHRITRLEEDKIALAHLLDDAMDGDVTPAMRAKLTELQSLHMLHYEVENRPFFGPPW